MASAAAAATGSVSMVGGSTASTPAGTPISKAQAAKKAFDNKWAALRGKVHTIVKDVRHDGDDKTAAKSMAGAVDKASMPPAKRLPHVSGARKLRRVSLNMQQLTSAIKTIGVAGLRNNIIQVYRALLNKTPVTRTQTPAAQLPHHVCVCVILRCACSPGAVDQQARRPMFKSLPSSQSRPSSSKSSTQSTTKPCVEC